MELDYYLWKNKIKKKKFAERLDIAPHTLSLIVNKKTCPTLFTALKIYFETKGKVSFFEMLRSEEREKLKKIYGIVKKDCVYKDDTIDDTLTNLKNGIRNEHTSEES